MKPVPLHKPIPYGDGTLSELSFRRPMAGDLRGMKLGGLAEMDVDTVLKIAARTSTVHLTEAHLAALDPADFIQVADQVGGFFLPAEPPSQTTPVEPGPS